MPRERRHPKSLFWKIADEMIASGKAEEGTMMGHPCLRTEGQFFATILGEREEVVVKLPKDRVTELIREEVGLPFAPAGRKFKEWVALPKGQSRRWRRLIADAREFVGGSS
ncbi:MAG: hypothetical protein AAGK22_07480 [Acidobacteriota bacterium]